jgi:hypothetical protein
MKNTEEFIKSLVKIDEIEDGMFGHYPFSMVIEKEDGGLEIAALALNGVIPVYMRVAVERVKGFKKIFLAVDFPKGGDMTEDFVAVFTVEADSTSLVAIPYNPDNGEVYDQITESEQLTMVLSQFKSLSGDVELKQEG